MSDIDRRAVAIANLLKQEGRGKENAITSRELMNRLEIDDGEARPNTRELVTEAITKLKVPIAASSTGYYIAEDWNEGEEYIDTLSGRQERIEDRKRAFVRAMNLAGQNGRGSV